MELTTLTYRTGLGWSIPFPNLDSENTLVLVFAAPEFIDNPAPILELCDMYPNSKIVGCSSAGEISGSSVLENSLTVAVVKFAHSKIRIVKKALTSSDDSHAAGSKICQELAGDDLRNIFILSDGLNVNGSQLVEALRTSTDKNIIITGGLAGDGSRFQQTWAIWNREILKNHIIGVGFYGNHIHVGHASRGGWDIFGPERVITKSDKNILYELDNKPALELYKKYLGERASELPSSGLLFPLAIRKNQTDTHQIVRTILAVDESTQSLVFAGDMPLGSLAQLMRANTNRLITAADDAGTITAEMLSGHLGKNPLPILTIAISCVGRKLLLGERSNEETEATMNAMPPTTQLIGFYSYGEISPHQFNGCYLHNQTMTLTSIIEVE